jgi:hypothetical protein
VLLTTYTLFERDSEENKLDRAFLKQWRWSCLMLDEAHAVKNRSARRTANLNRCPLLTLRQFRKCLPDKLFDNLNSALTIRVGFWIGMNACHAKQYGMVWQ